MPAMVPIRIDDHIYYRRVDNQADCLTVYRFPVDGLAEWNDYANPDCDDQNSNETQPR